MKRKTSVAVALVLLIVALLVMRVVRSLGTFDVPSEYHLNIELPIQWPREHIVTWWEGGVWKENIPDVQRRLDSPSFLERLREALPQHASILEGWTSENVELRAWSLGDRFMVSCSGPMYGTYTRHLLSQSSSVDKARNAQLADDMRPILLTLVQEVRHALPTE
ncbi:hypothetical protein LCGC14_0094370 [marine sediment metagenome]|uniref:Uncharacterized protein n=1 Tax=marine sediment metagenome TaxID=412755 RepID=A0A0F9VUA3_9ZZZZ|nr:hypothetical protein [Phycisphaerae bacterium]HDZ45217.1 hypothetical protein [Phycisphaerae bacterium]